MTTDLPVRQRRTHSIEFKTDLVTQCRQPGISVLAVSLTHGVNANLLRRWIKQFPLDAQFPVAPVPGGLVPVQVEAAQSSPPDGDIQLDIQRGSTRIHIRWPLAEAGACAQWLGEWVK